MTAPPAALPRRRRLRFARWRPGVAVGVVAGALVGSQLVALAIINAAGGDDAPLGIQAGVLVLADALLLAAVLWFARRGAEKLGAATLGIRRTKFWQSVGWMLVIYFAVSVFNIVWLALVGTGGGGPSRAHESGHHASALVIGIYIFGVAVTAPIVEETSFRGYLFPALTRWRGPWIGALCTAALFGLAHCAVYPPQLLPLMAVFGFGACLLYWFTRSLLPCVALHAMNNSLVTGIQLHWTWQVPLLMLGCMTVALLLLAPFAREREGQFAPVTPGRTPWPQPSQTS
jgi:membrane protease YdiL (CAAX protease family)